MMDGLLSEIASSFMVRTVAADVTVFHAMRILAAGKEV
jgi:hypothetical protein